MVHEQTLLFSLCSLILVLGVISKAVNKAAFDVSLCHDMFQWTNVIWLFMDLLILSRVDVVIIVTKLVFHLCCVCKLVYSSSTNNTLWWCYRSRHRFIALLWEEEGLCDNEEGRSTVVVEYLYWFLMLWLHGECWWGHSKIHKNDTSKALQCTHHCTTRLGY